MQSIPVDRSTVETNNNDSLVPDKIAESGGNKREHARFAEKLIGFAPKSRRCHGLAPWSLTFAAI